MFIPTGFANFVCTYNFEGDPEPMITGLGIDVSDWGGVDSDGVDALLATWFGDVLDGNEGDTVTVGPATMQVGQDVGPPVTIQGADSFTGTESAFPLWPNTSTLIRKVTSLGGRHGRGRMFLPGQSIRSAISPAGLIDPGFLTDFNANLATFFGHLVAGTGLPGASPPVLLHSEDTPSPTPITALVAQQKLATQRRRLRP